MGYLKKNAKKIILFTVVLLLSPFLIMDSALGLALAYTHWGEINLRLIGGIALIIVGIGVMIYRVRSANRLTK